MRGSKRREAILASAAPIFNRHGFAGTSIADILTATSLEKGGLYNHFASKEALAIAAFDYAWKEVNAHFARTLHGTESGAPYLHAYVNAFERYSQQPVVAGGCPLANAALDADDSLPFLQEHVREALGQVQSLVRHHVVRGVEKGHFPAGTDVEGVADFIFSALEGAMLLARGLRRADSIHHVARMLREWLTSLSQKGAQP
jgi:TetR/AcrR family transcriptional regulator, transcriptional repressor for nem operon